MITFVPAGGLGNRMRSVASAIALTRDANTELRIIWFQDWGLGCRFDELFLPLSGVHLKEASLIDKCLLDRPRRKNFFLPKYYEHFRFDDCFYEKEVTDLYYQGFDFLSWCRGRKVYLASCVCFYPPVIPKRFFDIFHPIPALQKRIDSITDSFDTSVIGVHVRRTDHSESIKDSPTELFIKRMKQEPETTSFYLATDSEEVKDLMKREFGNRIITSPRQACRNSISGMQDALIELYVLSRTSRIIGSSHSTFSESASEIGDIEFEIIKKNHESTRNHSSL